MWVLNFGCYQIAGYDLVDRMRVLLVALLASWAVFFVGLVAL